MLKLTPEANDALGETVAQQPVSLASVISPRRAHELVTDVNAALPDNNRHGRKVQGARAMRDVKPEMLQGARVAPEPVENPPEPAPSDACPR